MIIESFTLFLGRAGEHDIQQSALPCLSGIASVFVFPLGNFVSGLERQMCLIAQLFQTLLLRLHIGASSQLR